MKIENGPNGTVNVRGVKIWSTGNFHGHGSPPEGDTFTESDLDEMVKADREIGHKIDPRAYAGHPLNPMLKMLARPKGKLKNFRREGKFLLADLEGVDRSFWNRAYQDGARLSPDLKLHHVDPETGKAYPYVVVGLGVLGAVQPANSLLPPLDTYGETHYFSQQMRSYGEGEVRSYSTLTLSHWRSVLDAIKNIS